VSSTSSKRRKIQEMRSEVQSHGAFAARAHERESISEAHDAELPDFESLFESGRLRTSTMDSRNLGDRPSSRMFTKIRSNSVRPDGKLQSTFFVIMHIVSDMSPNSLNITQQIMQRSARENLSNSVFC